MKVTVDLPDNMYNVLKALSKFTQNPVEEDICQMVGAELGADLECPDMFNTTQEELDRIVKENGYDVNLWRVV